MTDQKNSEIVLTVNDLKKKGEQLAKSLVQIEAMKNQANLLMLAYHSEVDPVLLIKPLMKFCSQLYDQAEILEDDLNSIAFDLLECDNQTEIEAHRKSRGE
ncbi:hypothetical protein [Streptococcus saliviloxodontae]|uniref:Uncharacterized protein n=1 Tax=Streptococcus saliviloxodontae TaxID=1349416 RepID=A0ABS2PJY0_9STRE|nr:hypothetical protein [Streptococcus saliviloxodontae]MBM7635582.1 hypothetical protein [Streptococcus saliviloxodontae]